jgi:hypothetical protein
MPRLSSHFELYHIRWHSAGGSFTDAIARLVSHPNPAG